MLEGNQASLPEILPGKTDGEIERDAD